jgi:nitrous oxidase accessory protein
MRFWRRRPPVRAERSALLLLLLAAPAAAAQRVIEVRPDRGPTLQEAIHEARAGDRIVVGRGDYHAPTVVVDRPLTIAGEPGAVLYGDKATDILRIDADDVTVRGLAFRDVRVSHVEDRAAIRVSAVSRCRIENNRITDAFFGIYLAGSRDCDVRGNELAGRRADSEDATGNGIHLWTASGTRLTANRITGHRDGIYLEFAHFTRTSGNTSAGNVRYGLHFMSSDDCAYEDNVFSGNQAGVAVMYSRRVTMRRNQFRDNWGPAAYGLLLKEIYDSRVEDNLFTRNTTALLADGATRMHASGNRFVGNGWAVKLMASTEDAELTGNTFAGNTFDVATNSRGNRNTLRGNYWDQYDGYDLDHDGRGDVPHRPVRLFSLIIERNEPSMLLMRSAIIALLDRAERLLPSLTPELLADASPLMRRPR